GGLDAGVVGGGGKPGARPLARGPPPAGGVAARAGAAQRGDRGQPRRAGRLPGVRLVPLAPPRRADRRAGRRGVPAHAARGRGPAAPAGARAALDAPAPGGGDRMTGADIRLGFAAVLVVFGLASALTPGLRPPR